MNGNSSILRPKNTTDTRRPIRSHSLRALAVAALLERRTQTAEAPPGRRRAAEGDTAPAAA
ncbi:hypothetical protein [Thermomonospora catenispora]|uniref:hypothetical protein n=1 Tax=Thermomonospora catenispora TaxID=2493090 RepID=UPI00112110B9|nr:hypothetical protein [Thermomonospora catenispora]TNY37317.1 hypothetical protein EIO00_09300 [Thermomonospora catenispora]